MSRYSQTPTPRLRGRKAVAVRKRRMARTNGLCEWCDERGLTTFATVVDHIKPLAKGGPDIDSNTRNLCDGCHAEATAEQFGFRLHRGIDGDGRPTAPNHPWNRAEAPPIQKFEGPPAETETGDACAARAFSK